MTDGTSVTYDLHKGQVITVDISLTGYGANSRSYSLTWEQARRLGKSRFDENVHVWSPFYSWDLDWIQGG